MKNILSLIVATLFMGVFAQTTLYQEDWDGNGTGAFTSTQNGTCNNPWSINGAAYCPDCSGSVISVSYGGSSCITDETLTLPSFTPGENCIDISFAYGYDLDNSCVGNFDIYLYDETSGTPLVSLLSSSSDINGVYSQEICGITPGNNYSIRVDFYDDYCAWNMALDDILVTETCGPSFTYNQICNPDLTSTIEVTITALNGSANADISIGGTLYEDNVGLGTYTIVGVSGSPSITITDGSNSTCGTTDGIPACDVCALASVPSDEPCDAPGIDLSTEFNGSTNCSYTETTNSPSGCGTIENDSWLTFIAGDDTVALDWEVIYDVVDCPSGVQFSVWEGSCFSPGTMVELACENPALYTGTFTIPNLTIGEEYFIRIDGYAGDLCDYSWQATDGVATTPDNDDCPSADTIACGETANLSNIVLATDTDAPASTCVGTAGKGIWYMIQGTGGDVTLSTDNTGTNFDTQINVFSGSDCNSLTCIAGDDDGGVTISNASTVTFSSTAGTYYYVYIDGDGTAQGEFVLSATCTSCPAEAGTWN